MPQHSNGKAMSQPHNMWRPDSEFWSANRAEHRFADGYELVAFDLPAANDYPAIIGWELFGGADYRTLVALGQAASLSEAKAACETSAGSSAGGSRTSAEGLKPPPLLTNERSNSRELCPESESLIRSSDK